jgi:site-specific recombinase XerD
MPLPVQPHQERVFPEINGNRITVAFERACKRAGIQDFRFHDLRHTFARYLTMGGANLRTVQTPLGYQDLRITMRYSHLSPEHLQEAVATLERALSIPETREKKQAG